MRLILIYGKIKTLIIIYLGKFICVKPLGIFIFGGAMKEEIKKLIDEIEDKKFIEFIYSIIIKRKNKHL